MWARDLQPAAANGRGEYARVRRRRDPRQREGEAAKRQMLPGRRVLHGRKEQD